MKNVIIPLLCFAAALRLAADTPVEQAASAFAAGDLATAESLLAPLTAGAQPQPAALQQLSLVRLRQNQAAEAVTLAEKAVKLAPDSADAHSTLGQALSQRINEVGFMQQAFIAGRMRKAFAKAVELNPNHLGGLIGLSRYYTNAPEIAGGSPEKAKEYALRIQQLNPVLGATELGQIAEKQEDYPEALARYEAYAAAQPDHGWPQYLCGRVLLKLGRKDEARARFETALKLDPNLTAAQKALADLGPAAP